ncbi:protein of unknown function [Collimonas sp. OK607]|uniref:eCIS core domain-containing protein n=1 Tax=Collimonas sp. OK607 TaxID=1798194 RepID=UPI0008EC94DE|nr:DUF4157 domain-containing protein [Collimonas sp. OK607]SFA98773.1 protein of unknown function [Collimonas sp. OK607]
MRTSALTKTQDAANATQKHAIQPAGFVDQRPSAAAQRKLAEVATGSDRSMQLSATGMGIAQRVENPEEEEATKQAKSIDAHNSLGTVQAMGDEAGGVNNTGLPDKLKAGVESMSGMSMDHVKVHYNSNKPAQLNAHAYAQGSDIHIASGQEQHLPHEAWHVVQQAQGRVSPTLQAKGIPVNDDDRLESEADAMGSRAMQLQSETAPGTGPASLTSGVLQLVKQEVIINGITHLVPLSGGSIFEGAAGPEVGNGETLAIDIADPIWSRRGPNQEMEGNRREDRHGEQKYAWYPLYSESDSNYQQDGWLHLRDETFIKTDALSPPMPEGEADGRRARAAPTTAPPETFDPSNVPAFIANQRHYQNSLSARFSMQSIMTSHRSVGFEYEFGQHNLGPDIPSHIALAKSEAFSRLFPLNFELETDSGAVVEIGMPPFLVPNATDGGPDKPKVQAIDTKLKAVMGDFSKQYVPVVNLLPMLERGGLGESWQRTSVLEPGGDYADMALQAPGPGKLEGGQVYSQLNITLTGEESARFISTVPRIMKPNSTEDGMLGSTFRILEKMAAAEFGDAALATHLNKALVNTLTIPSILLGASGKAGKLPDDLDFSSTIKELYSLWIKDSVPNILATTATAPGALSAFAPKAANVILDQLPEVMKPLRSLPFENDAEVGAWINLTRYVENNSFCYSDYARLAEMAASIPADNMGAILADALVLRNMMVSDGTDDFTGAETSDPSGGGVQARYDARLTAFKLLVKTRSDAVLEIKKQFFEDIEQQVRDEIHTLLKLIGTPHVVHSPPTKFGTEKFGSGTGVRKDTHIPRPATEKSSSGLRHSVAEVRSDPAMALFYSDHWDKSRS